MKIFQKVFLVVNKLSSDLSSAVVDQMIFFNKNGKSNISSDDGESEEVKSGLGVLFLSEVSYMFHDFFVFSHILHLMF